MGTIIRKESPREKEFIYENAEKEFIEQLTFLFFNSQVLNMKDIINYFTAKQHLETMLAFFPRVKTILDDEKNVEMMDYIENYILEQSENINISRPKGL